MGLGLSAIQEWAARKGDWKVVGGRNGSKLFNLLKDLGESRDLSDNFKTTQQALTDAYKAWKKKTQTEVPVS